ncbi:MAG: phytanoyl-CoA dioxygenase family protein, partial [Gammaproteobacteria bacterium]
MLSDAQKAEFKEKGYVMVREAVPAPVLQALLAQLDVWVEESRAHESNYGFDTPNGKARFDLEPGHSALTPRLRRVANPVDISDRYQTLLGDGVLPEMVADLFGPVVFFLQCKLNKNLRG